jgi:hypothetical protein
LGWPAPRALLQAVDRPPPPPSRPRASTIYQSHGSGERSGKTAKQKARGHSIISYFLFLLFTVNFSLQKIRKVSFLSSKRLMERFWRTYGSEITGSRRNGNVVNTTVEWSLDSEMDCSGREGMKWSRKRGDAGDEIKSFFRIFTLKFKGTVSRD